MDVSWDFRPVNTAPLEPCNAAPVERRVNLSSFFSQSAPAPASSAHGGSTHVFGVTLIGASPQNLHKLLLTLAFVAIAWIVGWVVRHILKLFIGSRAGTRFQFWAKQGVSLILAVIVILGVASIWFDSPARLASVVGLVGAGIAFALQRVSPRSPAIS
jgi:hypothetical protein